MKTNRIPMLALALAAISPAHAQVQSDPSLDGFSLPPSSRQPEAQGPVTEGVARPRAPRPAAPTPPTVIIPAPDQTVERPVSRPTPAPQTRAQAQAQAQAQAAQSQQAPRAPAPAEQAVTPAPATAAPEPAANAAPAAQAPTPATNALPPLPAPAESAATPAPAPIATRDSGSIASTPMFRWGMLAALLALVLAAIAFAWHRFVRGESYTSVPVIEPPRPRARPREPQEPAAPQPSPAQEKARELEEALDREEAAEALLPLRCAFEVTRLSVTLMKATLFYRITLTNTSDRLIRDISVGGDMVSAHSSLSMEQQMANAGESLEIQHMVPAMLPGQSIFLSGDLALPISSIRVVRKGEAALFVPLARLKIEAEGLEMALLRTSLVGQRPAGPGAGLRPFRLDLGPRIYSEIGQRTLAVPA